MKLQHKTPYEVWEVDSLRVWEMITYVCLDFYRRPSDEARMAIANSTFIYGWLPGAKRACWHTVATPESRVKAQEIVRL